MSSEAKELRRDSRIRVQRVGRLSTLELIELLIMDIETSLKRIFLKDTALVSLKTQLYVSVFYRFPFVV